MWWNIGVVVVITLFLVYIITVYLRDDDTVHVRAKDGNTYAVLDDDPHVELKRANILADQNELFTKLIDYMLSLSRGEYVETMDDYSRRRYKIAEVLKRKYNKDMLYEVNETGSTSYYDTYKNKIALCLRGMVNDTVEPEVITHIALHELAHVATEFIDEHIETRSHITSFDPDPDIEIKSHTDHEHSIDFWINFGILLRAAHDANLYTPPDFEKNPRQYCGIVINVNPAY